ncbi:hypothetical protein KSC_003110 [Ktedonobacter sp. SOSP1-52]|uniref:acyl carrier protein n=1 Tax=Ktedonobacter sp. SOSP1-52 TaxID=2778366 RepID=UPI001915E5C4|nr:acyl carrier protein [Ktedonobacter sp. SOSP1-52]GHO61419.1 hypothetical protein KSC_003110 [Ktedonobacter sp. SOSP1-52]
MAKDSGQATVSSRVYEILRPYAEGIALTPETHLSDDLNIDSIELVEVGVALEKEFSKQFTITSLKSCPTVQDLVKLVEQTVAAEQVQSV